MRKENTGRRNGELEVGKDVPASSGSGTRTPWQRHLRSASTSSLAATFGASPSRRRPRHSWLLHAQSRGTLPSAAAARLGRDNPETQQEHRACLPACSGLLRLLWGKGKRRGKRRGWRRPGKEKREGGREGGVRLYVYTRGRQTAPDRAKRRIALRERTEGRAGRARFPTPPAGHPNLKKQAQNGPRPGQRNFQLLQSACLRRQQKGKSLPPAPAVFVLSLPLPSGLYMQSWSLPQAQGEPAARVSL